MDYIGSGPGASIHASALLLLALVAAYQFGRAALYFSSPPALSKNEAVLFAVGLGLTALMLGIFLLGVTGFLTRSAIALLFTVFLFTPFVFRWKYKSLRGAMGDAEGESSILFK